MEFRELFRLFSTNRKKTIEAMQGNTIGRVEAVNGNTLDIQPVINKTIRGNSVKFPLLKSVPPIFLQGGASYEAMPISVGDYCLLCVCERCFDNWYMGQDEVSPPEGRMWDISDCFALVGINVLSSAIPIPQVITRRGDADIEGNYVHRGDYDLTGKEAHTGDREHTGNTTQTGNYSINGVLAVSNSSGNPSSGSGTLNWSGDIVLNGKSLDSHTHPGVQPGEGSTGVMQ